MISAAISPIEDLTAADQLLCSTATEALPLSYLDPINSVAEKERVERDPRYNPQFVYAPQQVDHLERLRGELERLVLPEQGVGLFFRQAREYLMERLKQRAHLGKNEYWQSPVYPPAPERVSSLARRILSAGRPVRRIVDRPFGSHDLARMVRARLKQYGLNEWTVVVRTNISAHNTDPANRVINIRGEAMYTMEELKRLVVHEVDTHVLRAANGFCQPYHVFAVGAVPSYLMTEEGLAVVNEERMGYIDDPRTRTFAGRVIASGRALQRPFCEVYSEQRDLGFSHDEAFTIAKRVKRGLGDTSAPGGYIKDQAYLWGRLLVEDYVLSGGDLSRLYVGKVALEHIPLIGELGLRPARYIPYPFS